VDQGAFEVGQATVLVETAAAIKVKVGEYEYWVPKSVIHDDSEVWGARDGRNEGKLVVQAWWAEKEGLEG
jgi:hypothetical protein